MLMVISIIAILGFAAYMWKLGLFSSLTMLICCIFAGGFAVTNYQSIAESTGLITSQPTFGLALCFGLSFLITLAILRFGLDFLIRYEPALPVQIDRALAGLLGIVSGMIMVAVPIIMLQLMPTSRAAWGYQPYNDNLEEYSALAPFKPDDFLLGLGRVFASAGFSNDNPIEKSPQEQKLDWMIARNTADHNCLTYATHENLMRIDSVYRFTHPEVNPRRLRSSADFDNIDVRVVMDINASGFENWWRLPATQFALYAKDQKGNLKRYFPAGYLIRCKAENSEYGWDFKILPAQDDFELCKMFVARPEKKAAGSHSGLVIDWVYQIPDGEKPVKLQFRNGKPVRIPNIKDGLPLKSIGFAQSALAHERARAIRVARRTPEKGKSAPAKPAKRMAPPAGPDPGAPLNPATNMKAIRNRNSSLDGM